MSLVDDTDGVLSGWKVAHCEVADFPCALLHIRYCVPRVVYVGAIKQYCRVVLSVDDVTVHAGVVGIGELS